MTDMKRRQAKKAGPDDAWEKAEANIDHRRRSARARLDQAAINRGERVVHEGKTYQRSRNSQVVRDERRTGDFTRYANSTANYDLRAADRDEKELKGAEAVARLGGFGRKRKGTR